jgi:hypothetical protein
MRRHHPYFVLDAELLEGLGRWLERLPIGLRAHHDTDYGTPHAFGFHGQVAPK